MAKNVERHAFERGYTAMLCNIEDAPDFGVPRVEALLEQHVAGLVFLTFFGGAEPIRAALGATTPAVFAGLRESWADSVSVNDRTGGRLAAEHLVALGHRRIAFLTSSHLEARETRARHTGYRSVLRAAGIEAGPAISWEPDTENVRIARRQMPLERLLTGPERHTAVFCTNDLQAIALLEFADRHGLRVPEDFSVVGFDDVHFAGLARISLTTVRQPMEALAEVAVESVLARLAGIVDGAGRHEVLEPSLIVRGSTAPPAGAA
jgi:LacI family transcriptional regulator